MFSLDDDLLRKSRDYAQSRGISLNRLMRDLLSDAVEDGYHEALQRAFAEADRMHFKLDGPILGREERNAR